MSREISKKIFFLGLSLFLISGFAEAKMKLAGEDFLLGLTGSYLKSLHSRTYRLNTEPGRSFKDGEGDGYSFGAVGKIYLTNYPVAMDIVARIVFENYNLSSSFSGDSIKTLIDDGRGVIKSGFSQITNTSTGNFDYLTGDILLNVKFWDFPVGITIGPSFGGLIYNNYRETFDIANRGNQIFKSDAEYIKKGYKYENSNSKIIAYDGKLPDASKFRTSLKFGLNLTSGSGSSQVTMRVLYGIPLKSLTNGLYRGSSSGLPDWEISSLELGFEVLTGF